MAWIAKLLLTMSQNRSRRDVTIVNDGDDMRILQNIPRIPRPSPESLKTVIDQMAESDPRVASLKPEQFIDGRFFAELEKEGFVQKPGK